MANDEHLNILEQGVRAWNEWRKKNTEIRPDLRDAMLSYIDLIGEDIREEPFMDEDFIERDVIFDDPIELDFTSSELIGGINFKDADLGHATLVSAKLKYASLSNADLSNVDLSGADLGFADLSGANLSGAELERTSFLGAKLQDADFTQAFTGSTIFAETDLSVVKGLDSVRHYGPSYISIDTLYKSGGKIPEVFLRRCGIPEDFIIYSRSLVGKAGEFYSCFISFNEADDLFSERLYNDLQAARVRCWRWKEDAKWGRTLMRSIDEAVHVYDKLVVICSEQSLKAPAVIREIERALQKEDELARQGKEGEVLFPIRLDDYIFTGWDHLRKADVVAKNVGDFRQWKDAEIYDRKLDRLIRDLKAESTPTA
jgi:TIR domain/Pentapeptide repeats (8 copies)